MDVYSFSMIMWELYNEHEPFDGDLKSCIDHVVHKDDRPRILTI